MTRPRILDPKFHYVPANKTDVRKTMDRERRRLKQLERPTEVVLQMRKRQFPGIG